MKKKTKHVLIGILIAIAVILVTFLGAVWYFLSHLNLGGPVRSDLTTITTSFGDEFSINVTEYDFPDHEVSVGIGKDDEDCTFYGTKGKVGDGYGYCYGSLSGVLSAYDYTTDLVEEYSVIIKEFQDENTRAYQFHWGILYTVDNGKTYTCVMKHEYNQFENKTFQEIRARLNAANVSHDKNSIS